MLAAALLGGVTLAKDEEIASVEPDEAVERVASGEAILIDVREPDEWEDGVIAGAFLLPLSDLRGEREKWEPILATNRDKELILYCRSGNRSGQAARILKDGGFRVANGGAFKEWQAAGQPVDTPDSL